VTFEEGGGGRRGGARWVEGERGAVGVRAVVRTGAVLLSHTGSRVRRVLVLTNYGENHKGFSTGQTLYFHIFILLLYRAYPLLNCVLIELPSMETKLQILWVLFDTLC
jgi:hypothetical protein